VYCESRSPTTCARVARWSRRRAGGRVVQIGFQRRHSEAIRQAARYVADGNAGRIVSAAAQIHYAVQLADPAPCRRPLARLGAVVRPARSCRTARRSATSTGVSRRRTATATSSTGASTDRRHPGRARLDARAASWRPAGSTGLQGRITTPDLLTRTSSSSAARSSGRTASTARRVHARDEHRHVLLRREGDGIPRRQPLVVIRGRRAPSGASSSEERRAGRARGRVGRGHAPRAELSCPPADAYRSTATVQLAMIAYESAVAWTGTPMPRGDGQPAGAALLSARYAALGTPWKG